MSIRTWLWLGTILNLIVFVPAAYMAVASIFLVMTYPASGAAVAAAFLFLALPVFCVIAPSAAWRALKRGRDTPSVIFLVISPLVYAAFMVVFLLNN